MHETTLIENEQKRRYPGLRVRREGEAVICANRPRCLRALRLSRWFSPSSRHRLGQPESANASEDGPEEPPWHGDLGHLEDHVP